jgi:hypothetical protein
MWGIPTAGYILLTYISVATVPEKLLSGFFGIFIYCNYVLRKL